MAPCSVLKEHGGPEKLTKKIEALLERRACLMKENSAKTAELSYKKKSKEVFTPVRLFPKVSLFVPRYQSKRLRRRLKSF